MNSIVIQGVVHGSEIHLAKSPQLPDGMSVTVVIQTPGEAPLPGEGIQKSFGSWADDGKNLDEFLADLRRNRDEDVTGREQ